MYLHLRIPGYFVRELAVYPCLKIHVNIFIVFHRVLFKQEKFRNFVNLVQKEMELLKLVKSEIT